MEPPTDGKDAPPPPPPFQRPDRGLELASDIFASCDAVTPNGFTGLRAHLVMAKDAMHRAAGWPWSAALAFTLNPVGPKTGAFELLGSWDARVGPGCHTSATLRVEPNSGDWLVRAAGSGLGGRARASVHGRAAGWLRPVECRLAIDYVTPVAAVSAHLDPMRNWCCVQMLQAVTGRLLAGVEMSCKTYSDDLKFSPALMAKYAGPTYAVSCKTWPTTGGVKVAYYRHCSDAAQVAVTVAAETANAAKVARFAYRRMIAMDGARPAVLRVAAGTDGMFTGLFEKRLGNHASVSCSAFFDAYRRDRYGLGIGISLE